MLTAAAGAHGPAARAGGLQPSWTPHGHATLTLDDEFTQAGLNNSLWETGFNCGLGNSCVSPPQNPIEEGCYDSANVTQPGDGYVHLALTNTQSTCGGTTYPYTQSWLDSKLAFNQTGGSWEARVFLPSINGQGVAFPAFWPTNAGTADEVDVFEVLPDGNFGYVGNTVAHTHYTGDTTGTGVSYRCASSAPQVGWHNFGVSLNTAADTATFYYDGTQLCQVPMDDDSALRVTFDNDMSAQALTPATWPDVMEVDWVRVWS